MIIRWRTAQPADSVVFYGKTADRLNSVQGEIEPTTEHVVELVGLQAGTRYFYSIGDFSETLAAGPDYHFVTHPATRQAKPVRVWAIGDCGTFSLGFGNQVGVRDAYYQFASGRSTDVWLALGDNAYHSGTDAEYQANFFNIYGAILRNAVLWSTIGNHETYSANASGHFPYLDIFSLPREGEAGGVASGTERYYSFNHANIHFVCLDSETSNRTPEGPMLTWLRADLEANDRDWLIAFWHSPPYSKGSHDSDNIFDSGGRMTDMRANAVRVLESYGVDLVLGGHSHSYERSYLLNGHYGFSSSLEPAMLKDAGSGRIGDTGAYLKRSTGPGPNEGAVYVVAGSSGSVGGGARNHPAMFIDKFELGSLVIDVMANRLDGKFLRETGEIDDSFTIIKGAAPEPLKICTVTISNGEAVIRWKSRVGERYQVERTRSLESPDWTAAGDAITATGATTTWRGMLPPAEPESFYRVAQLPAPPPAQPAKRAKLLPRKRR